ncbi:hypothetical protein BUALT_Bualt08G0085100 [Buddleja alternifolia]|uniref:J domain-containing protein n=1 Tax=Buddleja alternifolia TaxID=168488 RepID=A0AAV6X564_9LAMI|nr:hypothetical protein BUALT_Bualt08G0085100 [Buddleja alternifolia]
MASTSFALSNQLIHHSFPAGAIPPPSLRHSLRVSAGCATAERASASLAVNASPTASFYEVLGVQTGASCQEIKSAYRKLARVLHPDVASNGRDGDTSPADAFMRVHAAYATLSDPEKRAVYDSSLFRRRMRAASLSANGYSELTRRGRTWETDQCW